MTHRGSRHNLTRAEWHVRRREFVRRGAELPQSRLTDDLVREIRANRRGWTARQWAEHLGVHPHTIDRVRTFQSWTHVRRKA